MKGADGREPALELRLPFGGIFRGDAEGAPDVDELARHPFGAELVGRKGVVRGRVALRVTTKVGSTTIWAFRKVSMKSPLERASVT